MCEQWDTQICFIRIQSFELNQWSDAAGQGAGEPSCCLTFSLLQAVKSPKKLREDFILNFKSYNLISAVIRLHTAWRTVTILSVSAVTFVSFLQEVIQFKPKPTVCVADASADEAASLCKGMVRTRHGQYHLPLRTLNMIFSLLTGNTFSHRFQADLDRNPKL